MEPNSKAFDSFKLHRRALAEGLAKQDILDLKANKAPLFASSV
jgi:hypothetical protein